MSRRNPLKKKRSFAQRGTSPGTWGNTLQQCNCVARLKGPPEERSGLGSTLVGNARTLRLETCRTASDRVTKREQNAPMQQGSDDHHGDDALRDPINTRRSKTGVRPEPPSILI